MIGAGASFGAREDLQPGERPPLGKDLAKYLLSWYAAHDPQQWEPETHILRAERSLDTSIPCSCDLLDDVSIRGRMISILEEAKKTALGFEEAMNLLWNDQDSPWYEAPKRVNQLISWAFTTGDTPQFVERSDLYDELVRKLFQKKGLAVISLNYDVLFEEAVYRVLGKEVVWYPGVRFGQKELSLPVYKPHGSSNWFVLRGSSRSADLNIARKLAVPLALGPEKTPDSQREYAILGDRKNLVSSMKRTHGHFDTVMALIMPRKKVPLNWPAVDRARDLCLEAIFSNPSANATVIGVHVPIDDDDPLVKKCLMALGQLEGQSTFINPSKDEILQSQQLGFDGKNMTLSEFIQKLD